MDNSTTYITQCIDNKIPVSFSKYGDGEYQCALTANGRNCDRDTYTQKLSNGIKKSYKYMVENAQNALIGKWPFHNDFWISLLVDGKTPNLVDYHTIIILPKDLEDDSYLPKLQLLKSIKNSDLKKIIICNPLLVKSQSLLNIDYMINISFQNWFDNDFDSIISKVKDIFGTDSNTQFILITCCGMGSKVIICELYKLYPKSIFLDFGSSLDIICTKRDSRGWKVNYSVFYEKMNDFQLISDDWNDPKYEYIYQEAKHKLGLHV